jgi:hypothetical protein
MKKAAILVLWMTVVLYNGHAQPISTVIKTQAIAMGRAITDHDKQTLMSFMLPELKEMMTGDTKKADMAMDSAIAMFEAMGGRITRISYGDPAEVVKTKDNWQTVLPQEIALSTAFADIEWTSSLLAVSHDQGKHWYFTDPFVYREASKKKPLPLISEKLVIPPLQKPKITPKKQ